MLMAPHPSPYRWWPYNRLPVRALPFWITSGHFTDSWAILNVMRANSSSDGTKPRRLSRCQCYQIKFNSRRSPRANSLGLWGSLHHYPAPMLGTDPASNQAPSHSVQTSECHQFVAIPGEHVSPIRRRNKMSQLPVIHTQTVTPTSAPAAPASAAASTHWPGYLRRKIGMFRTNKFDTWKNENCDSCRYLM